MKKNIIFSFIIAIILIITCIIYFSGDKEMDNELVKIGYTKETADKLFSVFGEDVNCLYDNYIDNIDSLIDNENFDNCSFRLSIVISSKENKVLASSIFPASIACSNFLTAVLYADFIILFLKVFFSITLTLFFADLIFGM